MKKRILCAVLCAFTFVAMTFGCVTAWAANPEDALSTQPNNSACYIVLRLNNFSELLRWAMSPRKLNTFVPALGLDDEIIELLLDTISRNPTQSTALLLGMTGDNDISLQIAIAMPEALQPELDRVAEGKANPKDILTLLLGRNTPVEVLFGDAVEVVPGEDGMMIVNDLLYISAKDNILLLSLIPEEIKASVAALDDPKARLAMNRRFDTGDFMFLHLNYDELQKIANDNDNAEELAAAYGTVKKVVKGPMDIELAFSNTPEKFMINGAVNAEDCFQKEYLDEIKAFAPVKGGNIKLFGEGSPMVALGFSGLKLSDLDKLDALEAYGISDIKDGIKYIVDAITGTFKISEQDLSALLSGGISLALSGRAKLQEVDACVPGITLAFTGGDDANDIVTEMARKLTIFSQNSDDDNDTDISLEKSDYAYGFNEAFHVKSDVVPFETTIGLQDSTFAISVMDRDSLDNTPKPSEKMQALLDRETRGAFFIDFGAIRDFLADERNGILDLVDLFGEETAEMLADVLDVELSVPSMALYTPTFDTFALEFEHAEIDLENGVWAKLMPFVSIFMDMDQED